MLCFLLIHLIYFNVNVSSSCWFDSILHLHTSQGVWSRLNVKEKFRIRFLSTASIYRWRKNHFHVSALADGQTRLFSTVQPVRKQNISNKRSWGMKKGWRKRSVCVCVCVCLCVSSNRGVKTDVWLKMAWSNLLANLLEFIFILQHE